MLNNLFRTVRLASASINTILNQSIRKKVLSKIAQSYFCLP
ncbi:hypothetical protein B8V60_10865 [Streptococcus agalactiae]|nr:hypothetical protein B8U81_03810 [Streptococcus agalactiae]KAF1106133.1 hypothetical protein B8V09_08590 [Streptococcus agalactiae]KAF1136957.1 hypothetical protein B8V14_11255 [Streptococcus agalactiae]KAF1142321.1 hypothetical protein B8V13_10920 [Streptococcus agalactiae]KAF1146253.1 hypothetical protein B8V16_05590 [Streptococcus agalactiae]